jgi:hypothetical protein
MNECSVHTLPARHTATVSLLVAAVAGIALGVGIGQPVAAVLLAAGGLSLGVGSWGLSEPVALRQVGGSVGAVVGALLLVAGVALAAASPILIAAGAAVTLIAVDGAVGINREHDRTLQGWVRSNVGLCVLASAVFAVLWAVAVYAVPEALGFWSAIVGTSVLLDLVVVQCLLVAIGVLLSRAIPVLDRWVPRSGAGKRSTLRSLERLSLTPESLPTAYLVALAVQVVFAFVPWIGATFERFFGPVLAPVLGTGLLQHGLLVLALGLAALVVVGKLQRLVVVALGDDPSGTLAVTSGGGFAIAVSLVAQLSLFVDVIDLPASVSSFTSLAGITPVSLLALAVVLSGVGALVHLAQVVAKHEFVPTPGSGYAIGSAILCVAALAGGLGSLPAVAVFVGVAGAICCWDLGTHAIGIGRQLGSEARTDRAEFVHVTATTAVLAGAVVLVTAIHYLAVPALSPGEGPRAASRAVLGLGGLAVATVAFFAATYLRERGT